MNENKILQAIYTFFLGLLLAIFVGIGVSTFYPAPKAPEYPKEVIPAPKEVEPDRTAEMQAYEKQSDEYMDKKRAYDRDVSIITLIASVAFLVISVLSERRMRVIADGIMLGGLFTLLYSLSRSLSSGDSKYTFVTVTVGLVVVLYIGYRRYLSSSNPKLKKTAKKR